MIVSCGEAVVDFLPAGLSGETAYLPRPGGSPFNVAIAIARLGAPAGFFGGLSTDAFGGMLRASLAASGVDASYAAIVPRPSTLAFVTFADGAESYAFFDEASAGRMLTEDDLPAFPKAVGALHFGSLSLAEEPCGSAFEALVRREQHGRVISLDPNVRPQMIRNRAGYIDRIGRTVAMSDVVRLSRVDLAYLDPASGFDPIADAWLRRGAKIVILTDGANPVRARSAAASVEVPVPRADIVDAIGAGDAFMGALLAHWHACGELTKDGIAGLGGGRIEDALAFAVKAAAISVSRAGADPPWLHEVR